MNRNKLELIYSIGVLVAIPIIVAANTILITNYISNKFDGELGRKADMINSIIAQSSLPLIKNKDYNSLQKNLDKIEESQPDLMQSSVIIKNNDGDYEIAARSTSASKTLSQNAKTQISIAIDQKRPTSMLINTYDRSTNPAQAWYVITPIIDNNKTIAVITSSLLTIKGQAAIDQSFQYSFIVLIISIILIAILLFRHFKLVGYIQLLAKQRELNQTMNDFLSVATHELKAPTTIIKGYLSNVLDGDFGPVDVKIKEQIDVALSQTDRLNALVQDLLNVSRVDQGRIQYNFTEVDTDKILKMIISNYQPIAEAKGLKIIFEPTETMPMVRADEGRVQEVFTNLIDNAVKYTAKGTVTITQRLEKGIVTTNFRDTGFGMSPEAKGRLFQRFYRIKTSQTAGISGTGLGLWIIKQYIEAMGGHIDVETMEGVGSNFIVNLQAAKK